MRSILAIGTLAAASLPIPALDLVAAHGGGLAADGCHYDRKAGTRHCHRAPQARQPAVPQRSNSGRVYYKNCAAARAAGAAPVYRGDPGYGRHLDRDNDGIGCE